MISGLEYYTRLLYEERLREAERHRAVRRAVLRRKSRHGDTR